jgi:hypothetical protein
MRNKSPDQLKFNLAQRPSKREAAPAAEKRGSAASQVSSFSEAHRKRTVREEDRHVRAILNLVRHYK